jgi:preprotein translocase subunit SecE
VSRIQRFVQATLQELQKVTWPTPQQARNLTVVVLTVSAAISLYIGFFDIVFTYLAQAIHAG